MQSHDDDILEHALNFGIAASADRYGVPQERVYQVVRKFKDEIDFPCPCEEAAKNGVPMLCFQCEKNSRIKI